MATRLKSAPPNKNEFAENGNFGRIAHTTSAAKPTIIVFHIVGTSPLLQNNPAEFIGQPLDEGLTVKKTYKDDEEARLRTYIDPNGDFCHPCNAFTKALLMAATGKKFGKFFASKIVKSAVFICEPYAKLLDASGKPLTKYDIDRRTVVIGKARVLRCRPCWSNWCMDVPLEVDTAIVVASQIKELLTHAGRFIGIGDYRPEKGGGFGRFQVK